MNLVIWTGFCKSFFPVYTGQEIWHSKNIALCALKLHLNLRKHLGEFNLYFFAQLKETF